jgi:hypothetical protein
VRGGYQTSPNHRGSSNVTLERQHRANRKSSYLLALVGTILGGFVGYFVALWMVSTSDLTGFDYLGAALIYSQLVGIPLGAAIGIAAALALFKRSAPVLTALLSIPVWAVTFGALFVTVQVGADLSRFVDSYSPAILFFIPPLVVPLASRWAGLAVSRRRKQRQNP